MDTFSDINSKDAYIYQKPPRKSFLNRSSLNKFFVVGIALVALSGVGYTTIQLRQRQNVVSQASTQPATLIVSSSKPILVVGEEFMISILIDTKDQDITGSQLYFSYPDEYVEVVSTDIGTFMPSLLAPGSAAGGAGFIVVGSNTPKMGSGVLATIRLRALQSTTQALQIRIDETRTKILTSQATTIGVTTVPASIFIEK
jgi:hypothetical protein